MKSEKVSTGLNVCFVGTSGFPFGLAQVERQKLISKGLQKAGASVLIINRYGQQPEGARQDLLHQAEFEGVPFVYASGNPYRPSSFLQRNMEKLKGMLNEFFIIRKEKRQNQQKKTVILVSTLSFYNIVYYKLVSLLLGISLVIDNVEFFSSMNIPKSRLVKWDNKLYDQYSGALANKVVAISHFLADIAAKQKDRKNILQIPSIVEFEKFQSSASAEEPFFLYCGHAGYYEVISFILSSYELLKEDRYALYLVSNGSEWEMKRLKERIASSPKASRIKLFSRLPLQELIDLYMTSRALLIPLRPTQQDIARFPHKIGEYCAAKKVILSTKIGEVAHFFKDGDTALICDQYDETEFATKMQFVMEHPEEATAIGLRGHELGVQYFDHKALGIKLKLFLSE
ncbi:glycosyltransferase [Flavihumibacter sp. UBA7668]|uniref:glycosyltransferase n=1 Tax=Flavihumibacter sp. UBA7668 TaxID=1946542 RepID=UPI0025BDFF91|nr:glycosyltransferase [Flavihumibacter sp. UBA7668]